MTTCPDSPAAPDILAELRAEAPLWGGRHRKLLAAAADEIERLRARAADLDGALAEAAAGRAVESCKPRTLRIVVEADVSRAIAELDRLRAAVRLPPCMDGGNLSRADVEQEIQRLRAWDELNTQRAHVDADLIGDAGEPPR